MVVECIGLPGSGKTFLLRELEKELTARGTGTVNVSQRRMESLLWKAGAKIGRALSPFGRSSGDLCRRLNKILKAEEPLESRFGIYEDADYSVRSAAEFVKLYGKMMKSPTVCLLDEGLVHTLVKLCADFGIPDGTFLEMAGETEKRLSGSRIVICNDITVPDCKASLEKRNRHICAFDELTGDRLDAILQEYVRLNRAYRERYDTVIVSRNEETKAKIQRLLDTINGEGHNEYR
ncbi:MAG TPA: hypothetical protein DCF49_01975 [Lachnospiraceae bacterium]|nr:hypothetical protein [Lachnospiraceae bacterium]